MRERIRLYYPHLSLFETEIPRVVLCNEVFRYLDLPDLGALSQVNKYFNKLLRFFSGWELPSDWQRLHGLSIFTDFRVREHIQELELKVFVTWKDYSWLMNLPKLRKLKIVATQRIEPILHQVILQLKQLEELHLSGVSSTQALEIVQSLPNLTSFSMMSGTDRQENLEIVRHIETNTKLQHLYYDYPFHQEIPYQLATHLSKFIKSLEVLIYKQTEPITIESNTLENLTIEGNNTHDVEITLDIPYIKDLYILNSNVTIVSDMPHLESFNGSGSFFFHPKIQSRHSRIKSLQLDECSKEQFNRLDQFKGFVSLKKLLIFHQIKMDNGIIIDCPSLTSLNAWFDPNDTIIIKSCHLKELSIDCPIDIEHTDQIEKIHIRKNISNNKFITSKSFPMIKQVTIDILTNMNIITNLISIDLTISEVNYNDLIPLLNDRCTQLESLCISDYRKESLNMIVHIKLPKLKKLKIDTIKFQLDTPSLIILEIGLYRSLDSYYNLSLDKLKWLKIFDLSDLPLTFHGNFPKLHTFIYKLYHYKRLKLQKDVVLKVGSPLTCLSSEVDVTVTL